MRASWFNVLIRLRHVHSVHPAPRLRRLRRANRHPADSSPASGGREKVTMPELPEVETTRRGLAPHLIGRTVIGARHPPAAPALADSARAAREAAGPAHRRHRTPREISARAHESRQRAAASWHVGLAARVAGVDADRRARSCRLAARFGQGACASPIRAASARSSGRRPARCIRCSRISAPSRSARTSTATIC